MVDEWEAAQPGYSRTLTVIRRVRAALGDMFGEAGPAGGSTAAVDAAEPVVPQSEGQRSPV